MINYENIYEFLIDKLDFVQDTDDETALYSEKIPNKVWLYFGKIDKEGGPYFGYWIESIASEKTREYLEYELCSWKYDDYTDKNVYDIGKTLYRKTDFSSISSDAACEAVVSHIVEELGHAVLLVSQKRI